MQVKHNLWENLGRWACIYEETGTRTIQVGKQKRGVCVGTGEGVKTKRSAGISMDSSTV